MDLKMDLIKQMTPPPLPSDHPEYSRRASDAAPGGPHIRVLSILILIFAGVILVLLLLTARGLNIAYQDLSTSADQYTEAELAANTLKSSTDNLTTQARMFAVIGDWKYIERYFDEAESEWQDAALNVLRKNVPDSEALQYLESARKSSRELMDIEYQSMLLVISAEDYDQRQSFDVLSGFSLSPEQSALSSEQKLDTAAALLHDEAYQERDAAIDEDVARCVEILNWERQLSEQSIMGRIDRLLVIQLLLSILLVLTLAATVFLIYHYILRPLVSYITHISKFQPLPMAGGFEVQYLAKAYNLMYEENLVKSARLRHEAEHDPLTDLYNRGAFDNLREEYKGKNIALMIVDVDKFKGINDTYGHDMGDKALKKVARLLDHSFRHTDFPCRIGGDEFAVIMTEVSTGTKTAIQEKLKLVREALLDTSDGLMPITLSIGVAFSGQPESCGDVYKDADKALYIVKERGKNGCAFFGEEEAG